MMAVRYHRMGVSKANMSSCCSRAAQTAAALSSRVTTSEQLGTHQHICWRLSVGSTQHSAQHSAAQHCAAHLCGWVAVQPQVVELIQQDVLKPLPSAAAGCRGAHIPATGGWAAERRPQQQGRRVWDR